MNPMHMKFFLPLVSALAMTSILAADTIDVPAGGDIQAAIVTASDGDVIQLAAGTYQPVSTINLLGKAVTLRGATDSSSGELLSILDGQDTIRLLVCRSDEGPGTVFENLIVENGLGQIETYVSLDGGLSFLDCGAGLYIESANPTVIGCIFRRNRSVGQFDDIGVGVAVNTGGVTVRNSTFLENFSSGAVNAYRSDLVVVEGCTFASNAEGALVIVEGESPVVSECIFINNNDSRKGAGIELVRCESAVVSECTFSGNSVGEYQAGAMFVTDSTLGMSHCLFERNSASAAGAISFVKSNATLSECSFFDNVAAFSGGAVKLGIVDEDETAPSDVIIRDCVFARNVAYEGGAVYVLPTTDQSTSLLLERCSFDRNVATQSGGAIYNFEGGSPVISDCTFTSNTAADSGGAICSFASSNPTIENCDFTSNHASSGGAVASLYESMTSISGSRFLGNTADRDGGALYSFYSDTTTTGCDFTANSASESGGGMHNDFYSGAVITDCTFTDNAADEDGGGLVLNLLNLASATIDGCTFTANTAGSGGGVWSSYSNPVFTNCTFTVNIADKGGAFCGVYFNDGSFTDCTLKDNIATPGLGGAMYLTEYSYTTVTGSLICGNTLEQIEQTSPGLYVDGGGNLVTTECEAVCVADLNDDGMVDGHDLTQLLASWGPCPDFGPCSADFTADGEVNGADLTILLGEWGPCPG